jgi:hypothetical protein
MKQHMKKFLITIAIALSVLSVFANEDTDPGFVSITMTMSAFGFDEIIEAQGEYIPYDASVGPTIEKHKWTIMNVNQDGYIYGDPVYERTQAGLPTDFVFNPKNVLDVEKGYVLILTVLDGGEQTVAKSPATPFSVTAYTLNMNKRYDCGDQITAVGGFIPSPQTTTVIALNHEWILSKCTQSGTIITQISTSGTQWAAPGAYPIPSSTNLACDEYYRLDLYFRDGSNLITTRTKIFYISSYDIEMAADGFCGGAVITGRGYYSTNTGSNVNNHKWIVSPCNLSGQITGPAINTIPVSGAPNGANQFFTGFGITFTNNQWYLVELQFLNGTTVVHTSSKIIFHGTPVPVITGNAITCGSNASTLTATNLGNIENRYKWSVSDLSNPGWVHYSPTLNFTTPVNFNGQVVLHFMNLYGCIGSSLPTNVSNANTYPDFNVNVYPVPSSTYKITASPLVLLQTGISQEWKIEEVASASPYVTVPNRVLTNQVWGISSNGTDFFGYDGVGNTTYNPSVINTYNGASTPASFGNTKWFRITRTVSAPSCPSESLTKVVYAGGAFCTGCLTRTEDPDIFTDGSSSGTETATNNTFTSMDEVSGDLVVDIFPNPGAGRFVIQTNGNGFISIYDALGKQVKQVNLQRNTSEYDVDLSGLPKGIYIVNLTSGNKVVSKKLFLE